MKKLKEKSGVKGKITMDVSHVPQHRFSSMEPNGPTIKKGLA